MKTNAVWYVAAGAGAGLLAGFLGIGGGVLLVPILAGVLLLDQHKAHGTALVIIVPIAAVSAAVYALRGEMDWELVAAIAAGSVVGAVVGARVMMRVPAHRLRQAFGLYTIVVAALMLAR